MSLCSNADLCGLRLIAAPFCFVVHREVVICTDATVVYRLCRSVGDGCGSCCRFGFKSPFDRNFERFCGDLLRSCIPGLTYLKYPLVAD
jgi:hypothetical protein